LTDKRGTEKEMFLNMLCLASKLQITSYFVHAYNVTIILPGDIYLYCRKQKFWNAISDEVVVTMATIRRVGGRDWLLQG